MSQLSDGFIFGLHVLDCLGVDFDSDEVRRFVREVADGRRVLRNSSETDVSNMENNHGMPFQEPLRSELLRDHRDWCKNVDVKNVAIAKELIAELPH